MKRIQFTIVDYLNCLFEVITILWTWNEDLWVSFEMNACAGRKSSNRIEIFVHDERAETFLKKKWKQKANDRQRSNVLIVAKIFAH